MEGLSRKIWEIGTSLCTVYLEPSANALSNAACAARNNYDFILKIKHFQCFLYKNDYSESALSIASAASFPAPIAEITVAAPVTASPPA